MNFRGAPNQIYKIDFNKLVFLPIRATATAKKRAAPVSDVDSVRERDGEREQKNPIFGTKIVLSNINRML